MARFRKRGTEIEAVQVMTVAWDGEGFSGAPFSEEPAWLNRDGMTPTLDAEGRFAGWTIRTAKGVQLVAPGEWIAHLDGGLAPLSAAAFAQTYEPAT